jgi:hypothetical protein
MWCFAWNVTMCSIACDVRFHASDGMRDIFHVWHGVAAHDMRIKRRTFAEMWRLLHATSTVFGFRFYTPNPTVRRVVNRKPKTRFGSLHPQFHGVRRRLDIISRISVLQCQP